jgi:uncharacterized protein with HEPN domain
MVEKSPAPILQDIVDAIERIQSKTKDLSLTEFAGDWERLWVVERGVEIVSEASRRLPDEIKDRHPDIPWKKIAGIGNVLRHEYDAVSPRVLLNIAHNDLIPLERVCKAELMRQKLQQDQPSHEDSKGRSR